MARLIDANVLMDDVEMDDALYACLGGVDDVRFLVDSQPTVNAVEVVHGRWVSSGCGFDCCSECRKVYADGYLTAMGIKPRMQFNYCPNCGAKMMPQPPKGE